MKPHALIDLGDEYDGHLLLLRWLSGANIFETKPTASRTTLKEGPNCLLWIYRRGGCGDSYGNHCNMIATLGELKQKE